MKRILPCQLSIGLSFLLCACAFAQTRSFAPKSTPQYWRMKVSDSLFLRLVFPHDGDTLDLPRVRYAGQTDSTAQIVVNGEPRRVYPSGAFVGLVRLQPGLNSLTFTATKGRWQLSDTLRIFRRPPAPALPPSPTAIVEETIEPRRDLSLSAGDELRVRFRGSPGGQASFEIKKIARKIPMLELTPEQANGERGVYQGIYRLPNYEGYKPEPIHFKLRGADGKEKKAESPGRLQILPESVPLVAVTSDSSNSLRVAPHGAILTELPMGIRLRVVGREGEIARVRLAQGVEAYTNSSNLKFLPAGTSLPRARVGGISASVNSQWVRLRITLSEAVPFKIEQFLQPQALEITFFGAAQGSEWTTYPHADSTIRFIRWRQESTDRHVLRVELNQRQQWGYDGRYLGNDFILQIRREPTIAAPPASPVQGIIFAVDAGHGGAEPGAIGATGLLEKEVNLKYAMKVADLLTQKGAIVIRTRTTDTTMTLKARTDKARQANAHFFVWLHNNSIGEASDPEAVRGISSYYTVPQSLEITRQVYPRLLELGLPPFGQIASTYFVTRQTGFIAFLVEGAFLSNPLDEMLLRDEAFLDRLAGAVVTGIEDFLSRMRR
ncbi:MAG: N-acetylmuramoyl-L-alanine amidase [candidate division KSB1 bacterium]|nr:N-acetylmuramoyl-L-alanine amidase [candidate division KSB1 bacterium]MDZ7303607.1 N-acetylmuramoyl-L-alanine amidase [candidate division KSB1 bacterium]MDZ7312844.1 N-acetylmuramoyl-L-alanine amidase [candidate division KSB1 bacterium]